MPKQKIVYVGYELLDGLAPHQGMAALWLALNGHEVTFLAMSNSPPPAWVAAIPTLDYRTFSGIRRIAGLRLARALHGILRADEPDYCYVQGAQLALLCWWVPFRFPAQKIVYHTQDFRPFITRAFSTAERVLARRSDLVICNEINRAKMMELVHGLSRTPEVMRTALPAHWYVPNRGAMRERVLGEIPEDRREGATLIAAGGGFAHRRRSQELVQAMAHLSDNHYLVFTGMRSSSPARDECLRCAEESGVRQKLIFMDRLEYFELLSLYADCEVGILLYCDSDLENFYQGPGRVTEYLRAGIPFVTSHWPGLELLVIKYDVGAVSNPDDPKDIARAIRELTPASEAERASTADRLQGTAGGLLAYEHDAGRVLGGLFTQCDEYHEHPFWDFIQENAAPPSITQPN